jgi:hypothetical protein
MPGNVAVWRGPSEDAGGSGRCGLIDQLTANSAKPRFGAVQLTTMRTNRFEPHPAVVTKDRIR